MRYIVSAASDPAVTSRAGADRLLRTEPQVYLWRIHNKQLFKQLHVALSKNVSKGVGKVPVLVGAVLACVAFKTRHFKHGNELKEDRFRLPPPSTGSGCFLSVM